jgi:hypothetical protein
VDDSFVKSYGDYDWRLRPLSDRRVEVLLLKDTNVAFGSPEISAAGEYEVASKGDLVLGGLVVKHASRGLFGKRVAKRRREELRLSAANAVLCWVRSKAAKPVLRRMGRVARRQELADAEREVQSRREDLAAARKRLAAAKKAVRRG